MNQSPTSYTAQEIKPGTLLDLAEARNAVNLARLAGADTYAADTFDKAGGLLAQAEKAKDKNAIMMSARQAVQTAEDARLIALRRQEEEVVAKERAQIETERLAAEKAQADAVARAQAEEQRRRQAELDAQNAAAARAAADRERAAAEAARLAAERDRAAAEAARVSAEELRRQAEIQAEQARAQAAQALATAEEANREKDALRAKLREQLSFILETRETARGLIVNLSDVLFDTGSATLKPEAREKLARVSGILQAYPGLSIAIEGHTDNVGTDEYNQQLSERRAASVRGYLVQNGIANGTVTATGFGEGQPVAENTTASGRAQNRRVELVVSGDPIGTGDALGTGGRP
jgi:outer membrane protein OmpA-like peptidoglycan-associated protein